VHVVSSFVERDTPSTKAARVALTKVADSRHILVVASRRDEVVTWKSLRNVPAVHLLDPGQLNTYDVLVSDDVIFTEAALATFLERAVDTATATEAVDTEAAVVSEAEVESAADTAVEMAADADTEAETGEEENQ
jgi:large subunit ribosomal protein L4